MGLSPTSAEDEHTHWRHVDALFTEALDVEPGERTAFLDRSCRGDARLQREVQALLDAHEAAAHFLEDPADWIAVPPLPGLTKGEGARDEPAALEGWRIGAYHLLEKLGEGGMGTVWLAERADGQFEHRVALKLVRAGIASEEIRSRFRRERQILARLSHPNIARLLDGGVFIGPGGEEQPYLVMELVAGEPITAYCDARALSTEARLALFTQVAEAIQYAHHSLIIHRDIKPPNVLVTDDGQGRPVVKLLDFGIARLLEEEEAGIRTLLPGLTPEYASPEQVRGEPVTTASDVYSLGVVLYELLTGQRPYAFTRYTPSEIERVVCEQEPEPPSTAVTRTPEAAGPSRAAEPGVLRRFRSDLDALVLKALRKEPSARYATADALLDDIRRYLAGQPVQAHPPTPGYRLRTFVRRHRWGVSATAAFVLLLLTATTVTAVQAGVVAAERDHARSEADKATRVTDFLLSLFEANDPEVARGDTLTAGELMERGLRQADALGRQPDVQARMFEVIGRTYDRMGRTDLARAPLERALALQRQRHPAPHPDLARSLLLAGSISSDLGDYVYAEPLLREALAAQRGFLEPGDPELGATLYRLGGLLHFQGRQAESEALFQEALQIFRRSPPAVEPEAIGYLTDMARHLHYSRSYADAVTLYGRAIWMQEVYYSDSHPSLAVPLIELADALLGVQRYEESEQVARRGMGIALTQLGSHHEVVQRGRRALAMALLHQGRYTEAESLLRQALQEGPYLDTQLKAGMLLRLGQVLREQERFEEAEANINESIRLRVEGLGEGNAFVGEGLVALGRLERLRHNYGVAAVYLTRARAIYAASLQADHPWQAFALLELGHVRVASGAFAEAEPLLRESWAILEQNAPASPYWRSEVQRLLGVISTHLGRYEEAESLLRASLRSAEAVYRPGQTELVQQALRDLTAAQSRMPR